MEAAKMLLISPQPTSMTSPPANKFNVKCRLARPTHSPPKVLAMAKESRDDTGGGIVEKTATTGSLVSTLVIGWSLYTLKTTGCGLPLGPGGSIGALEGVSYLVVLGIVAWSLYTKAKTGSGLPNAHPCY